MRANKDTVQPTKSPKFKLNMKYKRKIKEIKVEET